MKNVHMKKMKRVGFRKDGGESNDQPFTAEKGKKENGL
jgi:hypothetical protein